MSRKTRSGAPRRNNSTASRRLAHSSIRVTLLICCSTPRRRRRAGASSSTMIARMIGKGDIDRRQHAARTGWGRVGQLEPMAWAVELDEAGAGIRDPESAAAAPPIAGVAWVIVETGTVVAHREVQATAFARRRDLHLGYAAVGEDAVADRILHEGLEHERGHSGGCGPRIDAERHAQAIAEARLLNGDVMIQQLELLFQCDKRTALPVKGLPQQLGEPGDHAVRLLRVL